MEVRRVRGGRQSSASSTEAGDLSPQCESYAMVSWFLAYGATHTEIAPLSILNPRLACRFIR